MSDRKTSKDSKLAVKKETLRRLDPLRPEELAAVVGGVGRPYSTAKKGTAQY